MGYSHLYLVPMGSEPQPTEYAIRVNELLLRTQVILEPVRSKREFFSPGKLSAQPFEMIEGVECGFESGNIFNGPHVTIVPEDDGALEPKCPKCQGDVSAPLNRLYVPDEQTWVDDIDFRTATVSCPQCQSVFRPDEVEDPTGIFLTDRYVCFMDPGGTLRPQWLAEFGEHIGAPHRAFSYGYT